MQWAVGRCLASAREMDDPALHKSPAALQVGLGWSKAKGDAPTESLALADCAEETTRFGSTGRKAVSAKRCGTRLGHSETGTSLLAIHCIPPISGRLDLVLPPEQDGQGRESEADDHAQLSLT